LLSFGQNLKQLRLLIGVPRRAQIDISGQLSHVMGREIEGKNGKGNETSKKVT
jgi:hypothetical protein